MTIPLTGTAAFFTRAGLNIGGINEINLFRGTTVGATRVNNIRAQYATTDRHLVDTLYLQLGAGPPAGSYQGQHGGGLSYYQALTIADLVQMAQDSSPLVTGTLSEALKVLIAQMKGTADSIQQNTVSVSVSTGTNTGDGVVIASVLGADGVTLQNVFAETMQAKVTADSYTGGATAASEPVQVSGVIGPTDPLDYNFAVAGYGSNASVGLVAIDAATSQSSSSNILNNSNFESWGAVNANLPDQWTRVTGVLGTDILKDNSPYAGSYDLKFLGDGATLSAIKQQFNSSAGTSITLTSRQVLAVCVRTKVGASAPAAGALKISLIDGADAVVRNDNEIANSVSPGVANVLTIDLTTETTSYAAHTAFFQLPTILPAALYLRVALSTAITNLKYVQIDHLAVGIASQMYGNSIANNIAGGPYVVSFSGATAFAIGDSFSVVVANNYAGKFSVGLWKVYDLPGLGLRIPASGSPTVSDSLVA